MSQNTSTAVMQRRSEAHDSLDHLPTPPWATRALCSWLEGNVGCLDSLSCWEPACAEGYMARALSEYFREVFASDVHDYGFGGKRDFLWPGDDILADWIISNPPFRLAQQFIAKALAISRSGVAMILRSAFVEGQARHAELFSKCPPTEILQFVERVAMVKGRVDPEASSATAYCWLVWRKGAMAEGGTRFHWLAPCRKRLERASDYPEAAA